MHLSQNFCYFLNAWWKSCSLRVFNTACDSASVTSILSKGGLSILSSFRETEKIGVRGGRHSSMRNWLFGFARTNSLVVKEEWWACSWLRSSPVSPFSVSVSLYFPCTACAFFPERLSNHCHGLHRTFSEICTKFDVSPLSNPSRNRIRLDTRL
jgi:hypothetical protein